MATLPEEGRVTAIGNTRKNFAKFRSVIFELYERQTDRQTDILITIFLILTGRAGAK